VNLKEYAKHYLVIFLIMWFALGQFAYFSIPGIFEYAGYAGNFDLAGFIGYIFYLGAPVISFFILLYVVKFYGLSSFEGRVWLFITIGMGFFCIGEGFFVYYDLFSDEAPFPSIADAFYLLAYLPLTIGFIYKAKYAKVQWEMKKNVMIGGILFIFLVSTIIFVVIPIIQDDTYGFIETAVSLAYPSLDVILLAFALFVAFYWGASVAKGWYFISVGIICMAIADTLFAALEWQGHYFYPIDLLFMLNYLLIAAGAFYQKKLHEEFI